MSLSGTVEIQQSVFPFFDSQTLDIENVHVRVNRECARARHSGLMCQAERSEWISSISEALHVAKERASNDLLGKSAIEHWRCRLGLVVNSQHFQVKTQ